jgi:hypothetical protein
LSERASASVRSSAFDETRTRSAGASFFSATAAAAVTSLIVEAGLKPLRTAHSWLTTA